MKITRMLALLCGAVLATLSAVPVCSAAGEEEPAALWNGREVAAVASANRPDTCMVMGLCYYYGLGIEQDIQQAVHWFTLGAEGGHADCMRELAKLYRYGVLVPKDSAKALSYMRQAIRGGNESAGVMLAWCYLIGDGVEQDFARAYQLFLRAARNGDGEACYWVGICHHMGYGVPADNTAAYQWYGVGAWHGCLNCMTALGRSYARAEGTRRDLSQSRYWLQRAQSQGIYAAEIIHRDLELAQAVTPLPLEHLSQLSAQQCWEQYLCCIYTDAGYPEQADTWLRRAVELGHHAAAGELATERFSLRSAPQQNALYLPALEKAAAAGDPRAIHTMANYYTMGLSGKGCDIREAARCIQQYAELTGCAGAILSVAEGYVIGIYTGKPDIVQAATRTKQSAEKGCKMALEFAPLFELFSRSAQQTQKN